MKVYTGQTRSARTMAICDRFGLGECVNRGELPPKRTARGWILDCGSFVDFKARRPFNGARWARDLRWVAYRLEAGVIQAPDFVVVPDVVGDGAASLARSLEEVAWIPPELPIRYLVVQEGMSVAQVEAVLPSFGGIFVGGAAMDWKLGTAPAWIELAHAHGMRCHLGRIGTPERVALAHRMGADSIDSCRPLWSLEHLAAFGLAARIAGAVDDQRAA